MAWRPQEPTKGLRVSNPSLRYTKAFAIFISALISILAIVLLLVNQKYGPGGSVEATFTNVLNTVLALGLIGLVYEVFLRDLVFRETVETIGLDADIAKSSLSAIDQGAAIDWKDLLEQADSVAVLVANPMGWMERDWNYLLTAAKQRKIRIDVYIPNHDGAVAGQAAERLGYEPQLFIEQLRLLDGHLETSWKSARQSAAAPVKGCAFRLAHYDFVPAYEIAATPSKVCLLIPEVGIQAPGGDKLRLSFSRRRGSFPADWLIEHLNALSELPAEYADEVK